MAFVLVLVAYWAGFMFMLGVVATENGWKDVWLVPLWPGVIVYGVLWGRHRNRRWLCHLIGHTWRPSGTQCKRCWLIRDLITDSVEPS